MASGLPNLVTRKAWGARRPKTRQPQAASAIRFLVVHYSAMLADAVDDHAKCASRVVAIQHYHMTSDQLTPGGASDIGYTWLVCHHGFIFKGRGWGVRQAATGPGNGESVAVCFLGGDRKNRRDVTPKARQAIRALRDFCERNGPNFQGCKGHRDYMSTSCPGNELYAFVKTLNAEIDT
jgi:hypothetical protein